MTTQTEAPVLNERVEVRFTPDDTPLAVRWRGRAWPVVAEPAHWFSRWNWWESDLPAGHGHGALIEVEYWRVQVQATSTSPLRTFEINKRPGRDGWYLNRVSDD